MILFYGPWLPEEMNIEFLAGFGSERRHIWSSEFAVGAMLASSGFDIKLIAFRLPSRRLGGRLQLPALIAGCRALYGGPIAVLDPEMTTERALPFHQAGADLVSGEPATFHNLVATLLETKKEDAR